MRWVARCFPENENKGWGEVRWEGDGTNEGEWVWTERGGVGVGNGSKF